MYGRRYHSNDHRKDSLPYSNFEGFTQSPCDHITIYYVTYTHIHINFFLGLIILTLFYELNIFLPTC